MTAPAQEATQAGICHRVRIRTADGVTLPLDVPEGRSVVDAAADAGHVLPSSCGSGTCGSCHATARGAFEHGSHSPAALPDERKAAGGVLLCRTFPTGDVDVDVAYPRSRIVDGGLGRREGTVTEVREVAVSTVLLRVHLDEDPQLGAGFEFEPGQFAELQVPGDERRRAYSMANTANWDGEAEFVIRLHEGGYFSEFLTDLLAGRRGPGERVVLHGPRGAFGLRESGLRPRVFVAGGTGLAPILSLLRRMADWGDPQPATLLLGVNTEADLPVLEPLEALAGTLGHYRYVPCVWRPGPDWTGARGTPLEALAETLTAVGTSADVYVSGPPALVDAVQRLCAEAGLAPDQVVTERVLPT